MRFGIGHLSQLRLCHPKRHVRVCFARVQCEAAEQGLACGLVAACLVVTESEVVQGERVMWVVHHQFLELTPSAVQVSRLYRSKSPFKLRLPVNVLFTVCTHDISIDTRDQ